MRPVSRSSSARSLRYSSTSSRERGVIGRPSLHDDLLRGKETEVDYCLGAFLGEAEKRGVAVPTARATYRIVKTLEQLGRREPS